MEDLVDLDAALAEIIDPNDFLPGAGNEDEEEEEDVVEDPGNDEEANEDEQYDEAVVVAMLHMIFQAWRDTYFEPDLDAHLELRLAPVDDRVPRTSLSTCGNHIDQRTATIKTCNVSQIAVKDHFSRGGSWVLIIPLLNCSCFFAFQKVDSR